MNRGILSRCLLVLRLVDSKKDAYFDKLTMVPITRFTRSDRYWRDEVMHDVPGPWGLPLLRIWGLSDELFLWSSRTWYHYLLAPLAADLASSETYFCCRRDVVIPETTLQHFAKVSHAPRPCWGHLSTN